MKKLLGYLSFRGRANRQRYWMTNLLVAVLFVIALSLTFGMADILPPLGYMAIPLGLALYAASLAVSARRLHDRNKSAWWLIPLVLVPTILSLPARLLGDDAEYGAAALADLLALIGLPFGIWGFVVLGCLRGTVGPNKYGEDPLAADGPMIATSAATAD